MITRSTYERLSLITSRNMFPEKTITDFTNSVNAQSVLRLLQKILKFYRQKTIHLFVNNAAYDKSRLMKAG
ncbi:MAG: hypothetical protein LBF88_04465 [Planctomycetaceae bacterium]|nr:hypothetical protein [Planctomycetaceae bacterium]